MRDSLERACRPLNDQSWLSVYQREIARIIQFHQARDH